MTPAEQAALDRIRNGTEDPEDWRLAKPYVIAIFAGACSDKARQGGILRFHGSKSVFEHYGAKEGKSDANDQGSISRTGLG